MTIKIVQGKKIVGELCDGTIEEIKSQPLQNIQRKDKMEKWQEEYKALIISITDEKDPDFRRCLIEEGTEDESKAKILTTFIKENNIDCKNCWENDARYADYEKLFDKMIELDPGDPLD